MTVLDSLQGLESARKFARAAAHPDFGAHAVLLYGAEGSGKTTIARYLAQLWMCTKATAEGPCGACQTCGAFSRSQASDLLVIEPQGPSRLITQGQISETKKSPPDSNPGPPLLEFLRTMPLMASGKVVIIESADRMNLSAANALLKTLEEPHAYAKFVLTTSAIGRVLTTVVSRCIGVACELPQATPKDDFDQLSEGAPGIRLRFANNETAYGALVSFAQSLQTRPRIEALAASDELKKISEGIEKTGFGNTRACHAEVLKLLGSYLSKAEQSEPAHVQAVIEAHRRVIGNGNATQIFDALMTQILRG